MTALEVPHASVEPLGGGRGDHRPVAPRAPEARENAAQGAGDPTRAGLLDGVIRSNPSRDATPTGGRLTGGSAGRADTAAGPTAAAAADSSGRAVSAPRPGAKRPPVRGGGDGGPKSDGGRDGGGRPSEPSGPGRARPPSGHQRTPRNARATAQRGADDLPPAYAALDLGTNNCRLLVATPTRRGLFRVVDAFSRIVRLGEGLGHTNRLDEKAMDRAVGALSACAAKIAGRPIRRRRLIATEACRRAENGAGFIARVRDETGIALEVIDRRTEAHLAVSGCASLIDRDARGVTLFDIGGGSTEIALIDMTQSHRSGRSRAANSIAAWTSLPVGVVTLSERYGGRTVTPELFETMVAEVTAHIERFEGRKRLRRHVGTNRFHLLGTSGTVTTLAGLHLELPRYERRRVDGLWMRAADVDAVQAALLDLSFDQRRASPCIGLERADLVLAGCAILAAIRREWPAERLRVADRGLREGMLHDMMVSDDAWNRADAWARRHGRGGRGGQR